VSRPLPALFISSENAHSDAALATRGERKFIVTSVRESSEQEAQCSEWRPPAFRGLAAVLLGNNLEFAIFNQSAKQDLHYHRSATEIYIVVSGEMKIEVERKSFLLHSGDSIVVQPGARHEIKRTGAEFVCYVVASNSFGPADKVIVNPDLIADSAVANDD